MHRRDLAGIVCGLAGVYLLSGVIPALMGLLTSLKSSIRVPDAGLFIVGNSTPVALCLIGGLAFLIFRQPIGSWLSGPVSHPEGELRGQRLTGAHGEQLAVAAAFTFILIGVFAAALDSLISDFVLAKPLGSHTEIGRSAHQLWQLAGETLVCVLLLGMIAERRRVAAWIVGERAIQDDTALGRRWLRFMAIFNTAWNLPPLAAGLAALVAAWQAGPTGAPPEGPRSGQFPVDALAAIALGLAFFHPRFLARDLIGSFRSLRPLAAAEAGEDSEPSRQEATPPLPNETAPTGTTLRFAEGRDLATIGFALIGLSLGLPGLGLMVLFSFQRFVGFGSGQRVIWWGWPVLLGAFLLLFSVGLFIGRRYLAARFVPPAPVGEPEVALSPAGRPFARQESFAVAGILLIAVQVFLSAIVSSATALMNGPAMSGQLRLGGPDAVRLALAAGGLAIGLFLLWRRMQVAFWMTRDRDGDGRMADEWTEALRFVGLYLAIVAVSSLESAVVLFMNMHLVHQQFYSAEFIRRAASTATWFVASLCLLGGAPTIANWIRPQPPRSALRARSTE